MNKGSGWCINKIGRDQLLQCLLTYTPSECVNELQCELMPSFSNKRGLPCSFFLSAKIRDDEFHSELETLYGFVHLFLCRL